MFREDEDRKVIRLGYHLVAKCAKSSGSLGAHTGSDSSLLRRSVDAPSEKHTCHIIKNDRLAPALLVIARCAAAFTEMAPASRSKVRPYKHATESNLSRNTRRLDLFLTRKPGTMNALTNRAKVRQGSAKQMQTSSLSRSSSRPTRPCVIKHTHYTCFHLLCYFHGQRPEGKPCNACYMRVNHLSPVS